jgi:hypothetical protein
MGVVTIMELLLVGFSQSSTGIADRSFEGGRQSWHGVVLPLDTIGWRSGAPSEISQRQQSELRASVSIRP